MIFRSRRRREAEEVVDDAVELGSEADEETEDAVEESAPDDDLSALDELEWRSQGPWDITEVDIEDDSEGPRIDLGSVVLTGYDGMELRLQLDEETQQVVSAMMIDGESALEIGAFAAPRSGGLWPELRDELIENATESGGSASLIEGPFGVELRRLVHVRTPDGEEGYQPSRMWVAEGPRWMLRGVVYGPAALEDGLDGPVADLLAAFRRVVVRRGEEAMAPGDLLVLTIPAGLTEDEGNLED